VQQMMRDDIAADNACLKGIDRSNVTLAMHFCRGNGGRGGWHTSVGYDAIAEEFFGSLEVDTYLLEYDSDRSGGFEPLKYMPKGKEVVIGLVTTKSGDLDSADEIIKRVEVAAKYVDINDRALSPHCGFASVALGNPVTPDLLLSVMAFFTAFVVSLGVLSVLLVATGLDSVTAISGAATSLANIGPGRGPIIGPAGSFQPLNACEP